MEDDNLYCSSRRLHTRCALVTGVQTWALPSLSIVNKLRNSQAAHSGIQRLSIRTPEESKAELLKDCQETMDGFLDMLSHFEKLEDRMLDDLVEKGAAIELLRRNCLPSEDANFSLIPGRPFEPDYAPHGLQRVQ